MKTVSKKKKVPLPQIRISDCVPYTIVPQGVTMQNRMHKYTRRVHVVQWRVKCRSHEEKHVEYWLSDLDNIWIQSYSEL